MTKFLVLAALVVIVYKMIAGRWPWEKKVSARDAALADARKVLGLGRVHDRQDVIAAHKRVIAAVHPDRGGSGEQVHEANRARDLLLAELPPRVEGSQE